MSGQMMQLPRCTLTMVGATFDACMSFPEWADLGKRCVRVNESLQWVIGDWANWGQARYCGEQEAREWQQKYDLAIQTLPYCSKSIDEFRRVSRKVDPSIRLEELSWSHHQVVADLDNPKKQRKFLRMAKTRSLSVSALRHLVRGSQKSDAREEAPTARTSPCRQLTELCLWWAQQDIAAMPKAAVANWVRDLDRVVEIRDRLLARLG